MEALLISPNELSATPNAPTRSELLSRAKDAIAAGEQAMRDAAEALAIAQELHGASQAEMARAVGKSEAWVCRLLQWRREGYAGDSPFGPTTKAGRLAHAKDRAASGASKPRKPRQATTERRGDADNPEASAERCEAEYARQEAESETKNFTGTQASTSRKPSPDEAKGNLKFAIEHWWAYLDNAGKREIATYFMEKAGVGIS